MPTTSSSPFLEWMPLAVVTTALLTFFAVLFLANAVRKLDAIHKELKAKIG